MKTLNQIILLFLLSLIISGCTNQEPIDGKVSFAVQERLDLLVGEAPIELRNNEDTPIKLKEMQPTADTFLRTLKPTHQLNKLPLKKHLTISYKINGEDIKLFIPTSESEKPHKNIYLQGYDNAKMVYYRLEAGEKETLDLIEYINKNSK